MATIERPSGLIANKGIELLTAGTPNGLKQISNPVQIVFDSLLS
jgi:hypothetical protein